MLMLRGVLVYLIITHALSVPEFQGVALFETLVMPAIWAKTREWEIYATIKFKLFRNNLKGCRTLM